MKKIAIAILIAAGAQLASADGLKSLESFMKGSQTGRADFTQVVTSPPKDGQVARTKTSSGTFEFQRPGRFKFVYKKPFEQTIVADGQTLWLYDTDLSALKADFTLEAAPDQDGLQWVLARPKTKDGQLQSVRVGFAGEQLAALDILDSFGQRSAIRFTGMQANAALPPATFQFKPPQGADVVKQ